MYDCVDTAVETWSGAHSSFCGSFTRFRTCNNSPSNFFMVDLFRNIYSLHLFLEYKSATRCIARETWHAHAFHVVIRRNIYKNSIESIASQSRLSFTCRDIFHKSKRLTCWFRIHFRKFIVKWPIFTEWSFHIWAFMLLCFAPHVSRNNCTGVLQSWKSDLWCIWFIQRNKY